MKTENFTLRITTKLKTKDPAAVTVREVLTHDMGYGKSIAGVEREELWELDAAAKSREHALKLADDIAKKTWVFYNPNKHLLTIEIKSEDDRDGGNGSGASYRCPVKTRFTGDQKEQSALRFLRETFKGAEAVKAIRRYTVWLLEINAPSREAADKIAREIAVNTSSERGLLANPASQEIG